MFQTFIKKYHAKKFATTWQQALKKREIARNNYHTIGNIKKAKVFVKNVEAYTPHTHFVDHGEHIIFSSETFILPLKPAYATAE